MMRLMDYYAEFIHELRKRGFPTSSKSRQAQLSKAAALYRNAGYTLAEAAKMEAEEGE